MERTELTSILSLSLDERRELLKSRGINPRKKPAHEEQDTQIACLRWFRLQYPSMYRLLHHNVNEGKKTKVQAAIDKAMGEQAGMPDLTLFVARKGYHALHIELKSSIGKQSQRQKEMEKLLTDQGYMYVLVRTIDEFIKVIKDYIG